MLRQFSMLFALLALGACSHPLEIIGHGDILSDTGTRDCPLEDFEQGLDNCAVNLVTGDYQETYTAAPRTGWSFDRWYNYCRAEPTNPCSFNIPAVVVEDYWGDTASPLIAKFREQTTGFTSLFIGHSFFNPFSEGMSFHATNSGFDTHTQNLVFSGGATGAPEALWNNANKRAEIQTYLSSGDVELFGMTYHPDYPTITGYQLWVDYALSKNSDTKFFIGLPWQTNPAQTDSATYDAFWKSAHPAITHTLIDTLRDAYPGVEFYCIPYGQAAGELYTRFDAGTLTDVQTLVGTNGGALFTDNFGHADDILVTLGRLVWLYAIYGVQPETYDFDTGFQTDLKSIAQDIVTEHDPHYDAR